MRTTHTYTTTNIVIDAVRGMVWAENFAHDIFPPRRADPFFERAGHFVDADHLSAFPDMAAFTAWLQECGAVVDECTILGAELSDAERGARVQG